MALPRITEVAVGIVLDAGRVLIARRPPGVPLEGLWEFPGGKLEPGETPEQAAVRELAEELAVVVAPTGRLTPIKHDYAHARVVLTPVLCRLVSGHPRPVQCSDYCWATAAELPSYPFPPANGPFLAEVLTLLPLQPPPIPAIFSTP